MADLTIRGGQVVTPAGVGNWDVVVQGETIVAVTEPGAIGTEGARVIDASGKIVVPGGIEPHAHIGDRHQPERSGAEPVSRAAIYGGTTTVLDFATQSAGHDLRHALDEALGMVQAAETGSRAGTELALWRRRLSDGYIRFSDLAADSRAFPPMFIWLVDSSEEDLAGGFAQAAEVYRQRAAQRFEMLLYAALPLSIVVLGVVVLGQFSSVMMFLGDMLDHLAEYS
ncbi:MAG: type II secretion system F family protein [Chloroflexi bacterium]|nr:type II secretion system F family protein [Chloroflexota bacterium]